MWSTDTTYGPVRHPDNKRAWSRRSTGIAYETAVSYSGTRQLDAPRATTPAEYAVKLSNDIPEGPQQPRAKETATRDSATHCNSVAQLQRQGIDCCAVAVDAGGASDVLDDTYAIPPHNSQPDARSASESRLLQPRTYIVSSAILGAINGVR